MVQSPTKSAEGLLPVNKVVTIVEDRAAADAAISELIAAGFAEEEIYLHHGEQGKQFLDLDGSQHGFFHRLARKYQRLQGTEKKMFDDAEAALVAGRYLIGAQTDGSEEQRIAVRDALVSHTTYNIYFCSKFMITILTFGQSSLANA